MMKQTIINIRGAGTNRVTGAGDAKPANNAQVSRARSSPKKTSYPNGEKSNGLRGHGAPTKRGVASKNPSLAQNWKNNKAFLNNNNVKQRNASKKKANKTTVPVKKDVPVIRESPSRRSSVEKSNSNLVLDFEETEEFNPLEYVHSIESVLKDFRKSRHEALARVLCNLVSKPSNWRRFRKHGLCVMGWKLPFSLIRKLCPKGIEYHINPTLHSINVWVGTPTEPEYLELSQSYSFYCIAPIFAQAFAVRAKGSHVVYDSECFSEEEGFRRKHGIFYNYNGLYYGTLMNMWWGVVFTRLCKNFPAWDKIERQFDPLDKKLYLHDTEDLINFCESQHQIECMQGVLKTREEYKGVEEYAVYQVYTMFHDTVKVQMPIKTIELDQKFRYIFNKYKADMEHIKSLFHIDLYNVIFRSIVWYFYRESEYNQYIIKTIRTPPPTRYLIFYSFWRRIWEQFCYVSNQTSFLLKRVAIGRIITEQPALLLLIPLYCLWVYIIISDAGLAQKLIEDYFSVDVQQTCATKITQKSFRLCKEQLIQHYKDVGLVPSSYFGMFYGMKDTLSSQSIPGWEKMWGGANSFGRFFCIPVMVIFAIVYRRLILEALGTAYRVHVKKWLTKFKEYFRNRVSTEKVIQRTIRELYFDALDMPRPLCTVTYRTRHPLWIRTNYQRQLQSESKLRNGALVVGKVRSGEFKFEVETDHSDEKQEWHGQASDLTHAKLCKAIVNPILNPKKFPWVQPTDVIIGVGTETAYKPYESVFAFVNRVLKEPPARGRKRFNTTFFEKLWKTNFVFAYDYEEELNSYISRCSKPHVKRQLVKLKDLITLVDDVVLKSQPNITKTDEFLLKLDDDDKIEYKPRDIVNVQKDVVYCVAPVVQYLTHVTKTVFKGFESKVTFRGSEYKYTVRFCSGYNFEELVEEVQSVEDGEMRLYCAGDDTLIIVRDKGEITFIENDFSKYDQTISKYMLKTCYSIYRKMLTNQKAVDASKYIDLLERMHEMPLVYYNKYGVKLKYRPDDWMQYTGAPDTTLTNTLLNILVTTQVIKEVKEFEDFGPLYNKYGLIAKPHVRQEYGTFLKYLVTPRLTLIPELGPLLKLGYFKKDPRLTYRKELGIKGDDNQKSRRLIREEMRRAVLMGLQDKLQAYKVYSTLKIPFWKEAVDVYSDKHPIGKFTLNPYKIQLKKDVKASTKELYWRARYYHKLLYSEIYNLSLEEEEQIKVLFNNRNTSKPFSFRIGDLWTRIWKFSYG